MSTHPNVILMAVLKPNGTSRKTMRDILAAHNVEGDDDIKIGEVEYHYTVMESEYEEGYQISADEGDLVFFDMVTYGYGEVIDWVDLENQKDDLDSWAREMLEKFDCTYKIQVTANYW